jgi:glycolate oxidase iron-sulfur subunit
MKILEAKVAAIDKTGADRVITSNPGCFMQLEFARERWQKRWSLSHISQFIRMSLGNKEA